MEGLFRRTSFEVSEYDGYVHVGPELAESMEQAAQAVTEEAPADRRAETPTTNDEIWKARQAAQYGRIGINGPAKSPTDMNGKRIETVSLPEDDI